MNCPKCQCDHCKWEREFIASAFDPTKCVGFQVKPTQWSQWPVPPHTFSRDLTPSVRPSKDELKPAVD